MTETKPYFAVDEPDKIVVALGNEAILEVLWKRAVFWDQDILGLHRPRFWKP